MKTILIVLLAATLIAAGIYSTNLLHTPASKDSSIFPDDKWDSGFITLNAEKDDLFYILFRSRGADSTDPLVFWLTGGPGCSSEIALFFENGPYTINQDLSLKTNPYSWNNETNLVFIDQPIGTGYSRAASPVDYVHDEGAIAQDFLIFLVAFLERYPEFKERALYLTGESYAGHYIPAISSLLHQTNNSDINLKGIAIGNAWVDPYYQYPAYNDFAFEHNLISSKAHVALTAAFKMCQKLIQTSVWTLALEFCQMSMTTIIGNPQSPRFNVYDIREQCAQPPLCYDFSLAEQFLAQDKVVEALSVQGRKWTQCNNMVHTMMLGDWMLDLSSDIAYLVESGIKVLVYSGDQDFICNWRGGEVWTNEVEWAKQEEFRSTDYTTYQDDDGNTIGEFKRVDNFAFLRVFNAGHMVPMDQPLGSLTMLRDFIQKDNRIYY